MTVEQVPRVEFAEVRRFGGGIARGVHTVREGRWPATPAPTQSPLSILPCGVNAGDF